MLLLFHLGSPIYLYILGNFEILGTIFYNINYPEAMKCLPTLLV